MMKTIVKLVAMPLLETMKVAVVVEMLGVVIAMSIVTGGGHGGGSW